jgi:hypothetical protein
MAALEKRKQAISDLAGSDAGVMRSSKQDSATSKTIVAEDQATAASCSGPGMAVRALDGTLPRHADPGCSTAYPSRAYTVRKDDVNASGMAGNYNMRVENGSVG